MKKIVTAGLAVLLTTPMMAAAYEQGDIIVRAGLTTVQPDDSAKPDNVWAKNDTQLGLNGVYMATSNIGVELLASTPFKHDIAVKGVGNVGTTKHLPPTLSAQYYFNNASIVTPYVGAGINYTIFFAEETNAGVDLELKNSVGLALQAGADIALDKNWGINIDVRKMDIDTEVTSNSLKGTKVEVDPMVYSLTAVYKF
jgi:outer membrane protein